MGMITKMQAEQIAEKAMTLDEYNPLCNTGVFSIYSGQYLNCSVEVSKDVRGYLPFFVVFVSYHTGGRQDVVWKHTGSLDKTELVDMILGIAFKAGLDDAPFQPAKSKPRFMVPA